MNQFCSSKYVGPQKWVLALYVKERPAPNFFQVVCSQLQLFTLAKTNPNVDLPLILALTLAL